MTDDDIDPAARPTRRTFSADYKAEIVAEYDSHPKGSDERCAILRREGLYTSHISEWRKQAAAGAREGLARNSRKRRSAEGVELDRLRRHNERLARELKRTQTALEITGKVHALLEQLAASGHREQVEAVTGERLAALEEVTSTKRACELLGVSRATVLRRRRPPVLGPPPPRPARRPAPPNKLTEPEREHVGSVLRSDEYCDLAPAQVWARLLDIGIYLCSIRTMYRLLAAVGQNRERRRQRTHPARKNLS